MTKPKPLVMSTTTLMAAPPLLLARTKPKSNKNAIAIPTKKEMIIVAYITMVPDT
jgi:hypothetical protein